MQHLSKLAIAFAATAFAGAAAAQVTFYEDPGFRGRSFTTDHPMRSFERVGFNDRASSVRVQGGRWEACEDPQFNGRCVILRPGRYASLAAMGLNDKFSSVRPAGRGDPGDGADRDRRSDQGDGDRADRNGRGDRGDGDRYAAVPVYDAHRRDGERLYQADVTAVRAVVGPPEQRCWVERQQIDSDRQSANIPAGIAGAVIGGILGHQVGGGTGKDLATAGGAVAGAVVGANIGRGGSTERDVQRCASVPGDGRPDYWDVSYVFRGQEHRVQMQTPPGRTVTVNRQGEPRV